MHRTSVGSNGIYPVVASIGDARQAEARRYQIQDGAAMLTCAKVAIRILPMGEPKTGASLKRRVIEQAKKGHLWQKIALVGKRKSLNSRRNNWREPAAHTAGQGLLGALDMCREACRGGEVNLRPPDRSPPLLAAFVPGFKGPALARRGSASMCTGEVAEYPVNRDNILRKENMNLVGLSFSGGGSSSTPVPRLTGIL